MGLIPGIRKVVMSDGFDFEKLKAVVAEFNAVGDWDKIEVDVGRTALVDSFMKALEKIPGGGEEEKKIPASAVELYNNYADVIDAPPQKPKEKPKKEKPKKERPKKEIPEEPKPKEIPEEPKPKGKRVRKHPKNRAEIFAAIMRSGGGTRDQLVSEMRSKYGGSSKEAELQTGICLRLLKAFDLVEKREDGKFVLKEKAFDND